jgi:hypothetical protein
MSTTLDYDTKSRLSNAIHQFIGSPGGGAPDYFGSLDHMAVAEAYLLLNYGTEKWKDYVAHIIDITGTNTPPSVITVSDSFAWAIHASATIRAEAFLRAVGQWAPRVDKKSEDEFLDWWIHHQDAVLTLAKDDMFQSRWIARLAWHQARGTTPPERNRDTWYKDRRDAELHA